MEIRLHASECLHTASIFLVRMYPESQWEKIKQKFKTAKEYRDLRVGIKGPLSPYPAFSTKEKNLENFILDMSDLDLLEEETVCFYTRLRLSKNETVLEAGITISRLPRTDEIRLVATTLDLLSIQAYLK